MEARAATLRRELLVLASALALGIGALASFGGSPMWTRPLWMDEWCTMFVAGHATLSGVIANVAAGGDWAPPLLHVMLWSVRRVAGDVTPVLLRSFSLVCVSLALAFVYATLRRRVGRLAATTGVLAVLGSPLVITQAFEGRPYGPWLLFASAYAWSLGIDAGRARSRRRDVAQGIASIALTTIHWFGVISLGLIALGAVAAAGRRWRSALRPLAPGVAGIAALAICLPLVFSQRAAAEGLLWVKELQSSQVLMMVRLFWVTVAPVLALILLFRDGVRPEGEWPAIRDRTAAALGDPAMLGLAALALMPVMLMLVSVLVQPSMVDRYAILAVLAWAPVVAIAVETLVRPARLAVAGVLVVAMGTAVSTTLAQRDDYATRMGANQAAFARAKALGIPVVFQYMHLIYPVVGPERSPATPARFLDMPDSTLLALYPSPRLEWLRRQFRLERSQARLHARIYGFPILATQADLDTTSRFLLLATDLQLPGGYKQAEKWGRAVFPHHRVERINDVLSLFVRDSRAARSRRSDVASLH